MQFRGDLSNQAIGFECSPRTRNVTIRGSILQDFRTCIRINQCDSSITVDSCTMRGWSDRAITVRGTAAAAPTGVWITRNTIGPNAPGGISRQAIAFSNDHGQPFFDVHVNNNTVTGAGVDDKDPSGAGSADLVSLHQCRDFEVETTWSPAAERWASQSPRAPTTAWSPATPARGTTPAGSRSAPSR